MSKRLIFTLMLMALALFGLSACTPCDMIAPDLVSPDWREILDPSAATLNWNYTDTCTPDNFEIILAKDSSFTVIEHSGMVSGSTTTWTPPTLDIAEEYFWRVRAVDEGVNGPWSLELRSFFTGPICGAGDLVAPNLSYPDFGGIYDNAYESLEWSWPLHTCIPESYRVEVSMGSPSFADTTYNGATGTPGTRWGFGSTPPIATQFWWRVTASADGAYGPPSMVKMFWTAPACTAASLVAPVQESPLDNDIVTFLDPIFTWSYPDSSCTPEGQRILVSDKSDMSSIIFDANVPTSAARAMISWVTLTDCKEYYWQISAISESIEGPASPVYRFIIDTGGGCDCAPGSTTIPTQTNPGNYEILPDTNAMLRWYNPGGCFPDGAAVQIATAHDFSDMDEFTFPGQFVGGYDPPALLAATQYRWKAAYYVEESGSPVIGDYSGPRSFYTGPECSSLAEVVAPVRVAPADGSTVNSLIAALQYTPGIPGCIPDGYLLHLHKLADFSDPNLLTEYTSPATTVLTDPLIDCNTYYWSVTAVQDGGYGPESDHGSFFVDVDGTCLLPGVPGTAKGNFFCRAGTFELFKKMWAVETGHRVLAIARNPQTTYLKLTILDQETKEPFKHEIKCWVYIGKIIPGWPELPEGVEYSFETLEVEIPPDLPDPADPPEEEQTPELVCHEKLDAEECKVSGGTYDSDKQFCHCPSP